MAGFTWKRLIWGIGVSALLVLLGSGTPSSLFAQFTTSDRISQPEFWPTQARYPRDLYAGAESCAGCHKAIVESARLTPMAHAAMRASESHVFRSNPRLSFTHDQYRYDIRTESGTSIYTVMDGMKQESAELAWAFGANVAQTWLFKKTDGEIYEGRVSYFQTLNDLDFTPGRALASYQDADEAMSRRVGRAEVYQCFGCHTTASGMGSNFDDTKLIPGVSCEACHGPAQAHVDVMEGLSDERSMRGPEENTKEVIFNPKKLTPEESVDFCGGCHGSYWDINLAGGGGVGKVRFQPYRLEQSKCWNKNDARLTCISCHDPHKALDAVTTDYDHVCLSCHLTKAATVRNGSERDLARQKNTHPGEVCPVAQKDCVSCHMPEVYVPVMHRGFPDHRIRIAHEGEPFPD
jgi:hypothetical protein